MLTGLGGAIAGLVRCVGHFGWTVSGPKGRRSFLATSLAWKDVETGFFGVVADNCCSAVDSSTESGRLPGIDSWRILLRNSFISSKLIFDWFSAASAVICSIAFNCSALAESFRRCSASSLFSFSIFSVFSSFLCRSSALSASCWEIIPSNLLISTCTF